MARSSSMRTRPRVSDGTSPAERTVLATTEELLETIPLQDLTVAQILRQSGLSRASFYHYFANKFDVLVGLLTSAFDDSYGSDSPWSARPGRPRARQMGTSLASTLEMWTEHGAVICAVIEHMHTEPVVYESWQRMFTKFSTAVSEQITHERATGRAPGGPPADMVAAMLVGAAERVFYVSTRGLEPRLPTTASVIDSLRAVNDAAIYAGGRAAIAGASTPARSTSPGPTATPEFSAPEPGGVGDSNTSRAILNAMRELLVDTPLADLSVASVLTAAGVSRASFYFYFRSKEDAFVALFTEAATELVDGLAHISEIDRSDGDVVVSQITAWLGLRGVAGAVIRNAVHIWPRTEELRAAYLAAMSTMADLLEGIIAADRASGLAVAGPPAREFAATLLWTVERVVAGSLAGEEHIRDLHRVADMVGNLLRFALYGGVTHGTQAYGAPRTPPPLP